MAEKKSVKITSYIKKELANYERAYELGMELNISSALLSHYKTGKAVIPSLHLARRIYKRDGTILWPYSEEAVSEEEILNAN